MYYGQFNQSAESLLALGESPNPGRGRLCAFAHPEYTGFLRCLHVDIVRKPFFIKFQGDCMKNSSKPARAAVP